MGSPVSCDQASWLAKGLKVIGHDKAVHPRKTQLEENTGWQKRREKIKKKKWSLYVIYLKTGRRGKPDARNMQINNAI